MSPIQRLSTALVVSLTLAAIACGGGGSSSPTSPTTSTTTNTTPTPTPTPTPVPTKSVAYEGTFSGASYVGSFTIAGDIPVSVAASTRSAAPSATSTATCTYHFSGTTVTNTVTGTYDSATKTFSCANSTMTIAATIQTDASVTGTTKVSQPNGTQQSGVAAAPPKDVAVAPIHMCGTFSGGAGGRLTMTITGDSVIGTAWDNGANDGTSVRGTFSKSTTIIRVSGPIGPNGKDGTVTAEGALTDNILQTFARGTWSNTLGEKGDWTVSKGC